MSLFLLERLHARYDAEEAWQLMRTGKGGTVAKSRPIQRSDVEVVGIPVAQRWLDCHGQQARTWLNHIPAIVDSWAQRWHLVVGEPLEGGSVSVVYSVERDDGPAVLKLAAPCPAGRSRRRRHCGHGVGMVPSACWPPPTTPAPYSWNGCGQVRLLSV
jgi:hypothetical protein